ncbi:MAG: hypothetical protein EBU49_00755 [Proteobacteria bacterium]|nr:hypothetical protein [Pseudomonadota bacterium]
MEGSQKKAARHRLASCVIVARDANDLRTDLFAERLGISVTRYEGTGPIAASPVIISEPGIQLVAATGNPLISDLLAWTPANPDKTKLTDQGAGSSICILKWNTPARLARTTAIDVDNFLTLGFNGSRFRPEGLLGWGFRKITDAMDAGGDPVRMLTHLSRTLQRLNPTESRLELAKAAIANMTQGANATKITAATDGDAIMVELEFDNIAAAMDTGIRIAGWLDRTSRTNTEPCIGWAQKRRAGGLKAGILIGAGHVPVGLVIDETDPAIEPRVEPLTQTSYNVA